MFSCDYDKDFEKFNLESKVQLLFQIGVKFGENNNQRFTIQDVITHKITIPPEYKMLLH